MYNEQKLYLDEVSEVNNFEQVVNSFQGTKNVDALDKYDGDEVSTDDREKKLYEWLEVKDL